MEKSLAGPSFTCCWGSVKEASLYLWRKRRDALDLWDKYTALQGLVDRLSKKWEDLENEIEKLSISVERSSQYGSVKKSVSQIKVRFKEISDRYDELCVGYQSQSLTDVEGPRPRQKTGEMMRKCTLFAFARLYTKVVALKVDASDVMNGLNRVNLVNQVRPLVIHIPHAVNVDIDGHPHKQCFDDVLKLIDKEDCKVICIYRKMPGVGVSNMLKNINNFFHNPPALSSICKSRFACVIWVAIQKQETREKTIESIQKEIICHVSAPAGDTRLQNSQIITSVLDKKNCLLLLDDFPRGIKLEDIGIHGGKVVMTTKDFSCLRKEQEWDEEIEVKKLSIDESRYMFQRFFNKKSEQAELSMAESNEVHLILKELDGHLASIKYITAMLANSRNISYWRGLRQYLDSDDISTHKLLAPAGVSKFYKEAYERLNENWQKCLLFLSLLPKDDLVPQNYIIECWKAHSLLACYRTFQAIRAEGEFVCVTLEESCLLERACVSHVKLPALFRKVVFHVQSPEQSSGATTPSVRFNSEDELGRQPWRSDTKWISGVQANIERLPVCLQCDGVSALLLQKNPQLIHLETALFTAIPNLLVLDLHRAGIKLLPPSISSLTKLQCLYLNECRGLESLPMDMARLTDLEVLDIRNTRVHCLQSHISLPPSLKCLRISYEKDDAFWKTPSREWINSLEELDIEFAKGVEKSVVDRVIREVKDGFGGSDFNINLVIEWYLEKNLGTADSSYHLERAIFSPPILGLASNHYQPPRRETVRGIAFVDEGNGGLDMSLNHFHSGASVSKGNEIVEEANGWQMV